MIVVSTLYQVESAHKMLRCDDHNGENNGLTIEVFDLHIRPEPAIMPCTVQRIIQ